MNYYPTYARPSGTMTSSPNTQEKVNKHFGSSLNNGVCKLMAKEIDEQKSAAAQTMIDNYHQSGAKSWEQWVNNSPLNNIRKYYQETFGELENYQSQFTQNIYASLSQYLSSHVFQGSANGLIKRILTVFQQVKLHEIAPNAFVQIDMRSLHRAINRPNNEELVHKTDGDDADDKRHEAEDEQHSVPAASKEEMIDPILRETIDQIFCQHVTVEDDGNYYRRYEVLINDKDINSFKAVSNNSIPGCAFKNAPLCMIFNSTASAGQMLHKFCTETRGLITVSFHVYHGSINVYLYVIDDKGPFGSRIFADDLITKIPLLFEDTSVDALIMNEVNNDLKFFEPKPGYNQFYLFWMEQAVNQNEDYIEQEMSMNDTLYVPILDETINSWNTDGNKQEIINGVKRCFVEHEINDYYFQTHKRKHFMQLLRTYNIKAGAAMKLWRAFSDSTCTQQQRIYVSKRVQILLRGFSRKHLHCDLPQDILSLLIFYYGPIEQHLNIINWKNLELIKSHPPNKDSIDLSVTMSQNLMTKYCLDALKKLNNSIKNDGDICLIPISVISKHDNYEWILIVGIADEQWYVGISFKYENELNIFVATAIYLDLTDILSRHTLIGSHFDCCKQLQLKSFGLSTLQFIEDDNNDNDHGEII